MAIIKCPECGQSVSDQAEQCPKCGFPIHTNLIKCPECGKEVSRNVDKCPFCGFPIKEVEEKDAETKKKKKTITIVSIIAVAIVLIAGICFFIFHSNSVKEQEDATWTRLQTSTNVIDFDHFISEYPKGTHIEEAKTLRSKLIQSLEKWGRIEASTDYQTFIDFLQNDPNSPLKTLATNKIDSLLWDQAVRMNQADLYNLYLEKVPNGTHAVEARDMALKLNSQKVSDTEKTAAISNIQSFFSCLSNSDQDGITNYIVPVMSSFLNKKNATKADVITYMHKLHEDSEVTSITFIVNDGSSIQRTKSPDGEAGFSVNCSLDEKIERPSESAGKTFSNYSASVRLNSNMKIVELSMRQISSY